jgi:DNA polymerase-3 subunit gamma/tau
MPAQALYLKWRPMTLDEVVGQEHVTTTLRNALTQEKVRHAYLFSGPRGTGKTSVARLLAKAVNCLHEDPAQRPDNTCAHCVAVNEGRFLDLIEIDAASHTGVDDVRDLRDKIAFSPNQGRYKVYIIDEVHRFSGAAFDALLKTLEEPPPHALFVLATTEIDKVPATIKSRCQRFDFRRIPTTQIVDRLEQMVHAEGLKAERRALELMARQATGSLRDAISLLDQLVADPEEEITLEMAQAALGTSGSQAVDEVIRAMLDFDTAAGLEAIRQAIDTGAEPRQLAREIVDWLRNVLLVHTGGPTLVDVSDSVLRTLSHQAEATDRDMLLRTIRAFNAAIQDIHGGWQPQLPLELALVECTRQPAPAPAAPAMKAAPPPQSPAPLPPTPKRQPTAAAPEAPLGAVTLALVQEHWTRLLDKVQSYDRTLPALLQNFRPIRLEGAELVLRTGEFFQGKFDDEERRNALLDLLEDTFGVRLTIRVVVSGGEAVRGSASEIAGVVQSDLLLAEAVELGGKVASIEDKLLNDEHLDAPIERGDQGGE